jgi:hypothetical protein
MIPRRRFLQVGLIGGAVLAVAGVGLGLQRTRLVEPKQPLRALDEVSFAILSAVADRMFEAEDLPSARDLEIAEGVDALLSTMHPDVVDEVRQVLGLLENPIAGLVLRIQPRPFTQCSPEQQARVLRSWVSSDWPLLRTAYRALHGLCMGVAWSNPTLHAHLGYPGPPQGLSPRPIEPPEEAP